MNTGKSLEEQQFEACYEAIVKEITEQSDAKLICMSPFIVPYPRMYENWIPGIKQTERIEKDCRKISCGLSCASGHDNIESRKSRI